MYKDPQKAKEANAIWAREHPEKVKEYKKEWILRNKDKCTLNLKRWRKNNPEKLKEQQRRHYKNRFEKDRPYRQEYYQLNKEKRRKYLRFWRSKNVLSVKVHNQRRRSLEKGIDLGVVQSVYEDNIKQYGTLTCIYCLKPIQFGNDNLEHKQPLSRGGTHEYSNLGIACKSCNSKKGNKTEEEYRKVGQ